jgi:hypothetical protein
MVEELMVWDGKKWVKWKKIKHKFKKIPLFMAKTCKMT